MVHGFDEAANPLRLQSQFIPGLFHPKRQTLTSLDLCGDLVPPR
jgi:hypothetical protein